MNLTSPRSSEHSFRGEGYLLPTRTLLDQENHVQSHPLTPKKQGYDLKNTFFLSDTKELKTTTVVLNDEKQRLLDENVAKTHLLTNALIRDRNLRVPLFETDKVIVKKDKVTIINTLTNSIKTEISLATTSAPVVYTKEANEIIETAKKIYGSSSGSPSPASTPLISPVSSSPSSPRPISPDPRIADRDDLEDEIGRLTAERAHLVEQIRQATEYRDLARGRNQDLDEEITQKEAQVEGFDRAIAELEEQIEELGHRKGTLEEELAQLTQQNGDLTRDNTRLGEGKARLEAAIRDLGLELNRLNEQKAELGRQIAAAKKEIVQLEREQVRLSGEVKSQNLEIKRLARRSDKLTKEVEALERKKTELTDNIRNLNTENGRLDEANKQLTLINADLGREKDRLDAEIETLNQQIEALDSEIAEKAGERDTLDRDISSRQQRVEKLEQAEKNLGRDVAALEEQKSEITKAIATLKTQKQSLDDEFAQNMKENAAFKAENTKLEAAIKRLELSKTTLERQIASKTSELERKQKELEGVLATIATRDAEKSQLESDIKTIRGEFADVSQLRKALDEALKENARLKDSSKTIANELERVSNASESDLSRLSASISSLEQDLKASLQRNNELAFENFTLQKTVEEQKELLAIAYAAAKAKSEEMQLLAKQIASLRNEFPRSIAELGVISTPNGLALEKAESDYENAKADLASLTQLIRDLKDQLKDAIEENETLRSSIEENDWELKQQAAIYQREIDKLQAQLAETQSIIEEQTELLQISDKELAAKSRQIGDLVSKNIKISQDIEKKSLLTERLYEALRENEREIEAHSNKLAIRDEKLVTLANAINKKDTEIQELEAKLDSNDEINKRLYKEISKLSSEKTNLEQQINELQYDNIELNREIGDLFTKQKRLNSKIIELEDEVAKLSKENTTLQQELQELRLEHGSLENVNEKLIGEIEKLRSELAEHEDQLSNAAEYGLQLLEANKDLKDKNAGLARSYAHLTSQARKTAEEHALALEAEKAQTVAAQALARTTQEELDEARAALRKRDLKIIELEKALASSQNQVATLTSANDVHARDIASLQSQNSTLNAQITRLQETIKHGDYETQILREQIETLSQEKERARLDFEGQIKALKGRLAIAGSENATLNASTKKEIEALMLTQQQSNARYDVQISKLSDELKASQEEMAKLQESLENLGTQKNDLERRLENSTSKVKSLESANDTLLSEKLVQIRRFEQQELVLAGSKEQVARLIKEVAQLKDGVSKKDEEILFIQGQLKALTIEKTAALEGLQKDRDSLLKRLQELENENTRQKKTITEQQKQLVSAGDDIAARKKVEENYKREHEQLNQHILNMRVLLQKNQAETESLQSSLGSKIATLEAELKSSEAQRNKLVGQSASLNEQIDSLQRANQELSTSNAQNAAELARLQKEKDALVEALLAPDQAKTQRKSKGLEQLAFQMEFIAEATNAMSASDLSELTPEQLRALHTNYLLLHLDLDSDKLKPEPHPSGKVSGLSYSFEATFKDAVVEGLKPSFTKSDLDARVKEISPAPSTSKAKAKVDPEAESKHKALSSFSTQLDRIQSPIIANYNSAKEPAQKVNSFISYPPIEPVLKNLFDFKDLQPSDHLTTLENSLKELDAKEKTPSDILEIKELRNRILKEKLRLNIIRICSNSDPWFPKDIISLRIILDTFKIGELTKHDDLRRLNDATTSTLVALRKIFDELNKSRK